MRTLRPSPDFDWDRVQWDGPDERPTETCSYCNADLGEPEEPDYEIPLIVMNRSGWCARFCLLCQERYWGVRR
jgi:hypothetical protein